MQSASVATASSSSTLSPARSSTSPQFVQRTLPPILANLPADANQLVERFLRTERDSSSSFPMDPVSAEWKDIISVIGIDLEQFYALGKLCATNPDTWKTDEQLMAFAEVLARHLVAGKKLPENVSKLAGTQHMKRFCSYLADLSTRYERTRPSSCSVITEDAVLQAILDYKPTKRDDALACMQEALCELKDSTLRLKASLELQPHGVFVRCPLCPTVRLSIGLKNEETGKPDLTNVVHHFQRSHRSSPRTEAPAVRWPQSALGALLLLLQLQQRHRS